MPFNGDNRAFGLRPRDLRSKDDSGYSISVVTRFARREQKAFTLMLSHKRRFPWIADSAPTPLDACGADG